MLCFTILLRFSNIHKIKWYGKVPMSPTTNLQQLYEQAQSWVFMTHSFPLLDNFKINSSSTSVAIRLEIWHNQICLEGLLVLHKRWKHWGASFRQWQWGGGKCSERHQGTAFYRDLPNMEIWRMGCARNPVRTTGPGWGQWGHNKNWKLRGNTELHRQTDFVSGMFSLIYQLDM